MFIKSWDQVSFGLAKKQLVSFTDECWSLGTILFLFIAVFGNSAVDSNSFLYASSQCKFDVVFSCWTWHGMGQCRCHVSRCQVSPNFVSTMSVLPVGGLDFLVCWRRLDSFIPTKGTVWIRPQVP